MKNIICIWAALFALFFSSIAMSAESSVDDLEKDSFEGFEDFGDQSGRLSFKIRGVAMFGNGNQEGLGSKAGVADVKKNEKLLERGYGIEAATDLFFNDYLASEIAVGFNLFRPKSLSNVAHNWGVTAAKKKNIYMVPISLLVQGYLAPFGAISPYIGVGYNYSFLFTNSKEFKINNAHGIVMQAGVDFVTRDDTVFSLDVKQYLLKPKVNYKSGFIADAPSAKIKMNPLAISLGVGYKF